MVFRGYTFVLIAMAMRCDPSALEVTTNTSLCGIPDPPAIISVQVEPKSEEAYTEDVYLNNFGCQSEVEATRWEPSELDTTEAQFLSTFPAGRVSVHVDPELEERYRRPPPFPACPAIAYLPS